MTPDEEVDAMMAIVRGWPHPPDDGADLVCLVLAGHDLLEHPRLMRAVRIVLCRHPVAWMLRPAVWTILRAVDASVRAQVS